VTNDLDLWPRKLGWLKTRQKSFDMNKQHNGSQTYFLRKPVNLVRDLTEWHPDLGVLLSRLHHHHWHVGVGRTCGWHQNNIIIVKQTHRLTRNTSWKIIHKTFIYSLKLLPVSENGWPPYWKSISGFDFDVCVVISIASQGQLKKIPAVADMSQKFGEQFAVVLR